MRALSSGISRANSLLLSCAPRLLIAVANYLKSALEPSFENLLPLLSPRIQSLFPEEAWHVIDAGSPRVMIYDSADLRHRVVVFSEAVGRC
jgi:hypothetical protein